MPDNRRARRESDPGLQPERTSLAWFRTLLGYGALLALAIKHHWHQAGIAFWISLCILPFAALILWRYTRSRNLMNVEQSDFAQPQAVRDKYDRIRSTFPVIVVCCNPYTTGDFVY